MKLQVYTIALFSFCMIGSHAQRLQFNHPDIQYVSSILNEHLYSELIDSRDKIPDDLNHFADKHLQIKAKDHYQNFTFIDAWIYDIEKYIHDNPEEIYENDFPVPKIAFTFLWSDTTLGIRRHYISLTLDQLGQVIYFSFPNLTFSDKTDLVSLDKAAAIADSLIKSDSFEFDEFDYFLDYNRSTSLLNWLLWYSRTTENNKLMTYEVCVPLLENHQYSYSIETSYLLDFNSDTTMIEEDKIPIIGPDSTGHNTQ